MKMNFDSVKFNWFRDMDICKQTHLNIWEKKILLQQQTRFFASNQIENHDQIISLS